MLDPVEIICRVRPPSSNNRSGKRRAALEAAVTAAWEALARPTRTGLLYGLVIWFARGYDHGKDPDADNISKPVWDTLKQLGAFLDDRQVRLQTALILDMSEEIEYFDLSDLPERLIRVIETSIVGSEQVTYICFGELEPRMIAETLSVGSR